MGIVHGRIAQIPVMICRLSFSGERAYEVYCGAHHGQRVWDALMEAGKSFDMQPYGLEALAIDRTRQYSILAKYEGHTRLLSGRTEPKSWFSLVFLIIW